MAGFWDPKLPGLRKLAGEKFDIRAYADAIIEMKLLKAQQKLFEPTEREKFTWQQQQDILGRRLEEAKYVGNKMIEHYHHLPDPTSKRLYFEKSRSFIAGQPPMIAKMLNDMFSATQLSDSQRKLLDFESIAGARPEITADYERDPNNWIAQGFVQDKYDAFRNKWLGLTDKAERKKFLFPPDGSVVYRNPETDQVTRIPEGAREAINAQPLLKNANMTLEQAVASGGDVPIEGFQKSADGRFLQRPVQNIFDNKVTMQEVPVKGALTEQPWVLPETGRKILGYVRMDDSTLEDMTDPEAAIVLDYRRRRKEAGADPVQIQMAINQTLGTMMPGVNIAPIVVDPDITRDILFWKYDTSTKEALAMWPGVITTFPGKDGREQIEVWYDSDAGLYWYMGQLIGSEDEAIEWCSRQTRGATE